MNGNEFALGQTAEIGRQLGMGIGRLVKPLSLSKVVLRGSFVDDAGGILLTPAREAMSRTVGQSTDLELRAGLPGDDAVLLGVTDLSLNAPLACRSRSHQTSATAKWRGGVSYARVTPVRASGSSTRLACG